MTVDKKWRTAENNSENLGEGQTSSIEQLISRYNKERKIHKVRRAMAVNRPFLVQQESLSM